MAQLDEQFYDFLIEEDEPRACEAIPEEACTNLPKNFLLNVSNGMLTKLAEKIISPGLTLAWIMQFFGASPALLGWWIKLQLSRLFDYCEWSCECTEQSILGTNC